MIFIMTDKTMRKKIKDNILAVDPQAEVWLYGSRSRGDAHEDSDWDVLVLSPQDTLSVKEEGVFIDHMTDLMIETGQVVHLFAYGKSDWHTRHRITPFYQNVSREAVRL
jgi:predicted nucleotidyltransferase